MRLITLTQLRARMGGRSRNAIFNDIERGIIPAPIKLGNGQTARNYWDQGQVETCLSRLTNGGERS